MTPLVCDIAFCTAVRYTVRLYLSHSYVLYSNALYLVITGTPLLSSFITVSQYNHRPFEDSLSLRSSSFATCYLPHIEIRLLRYYRTSFSTCCIHRIDDRRSSSSWELLVWVEDRNFLRPRRAAESSPRKQLVWSKIVTRL